MLLSHSRPNNSPADTAKLAVPTDTAPKSVIPVEHQPYSEPPELPSPEALLTTVPQAKIIEFARALRQHFQATEIQDTPYNRIALKWLADFSLGSFEVYEGTWEDCHCMNLLSWARSRMPTSLLLEVEKKIAPVLLGQTGPAEQYIGPAGGICSVPYLRVLSALSFFEIFPTERSLAVVLKAVQVPGQTADYYSTVGDSLRRLVVARRMIDPDGVVEIEAPLLRILETKKTPAEKIESYLLPRSQFPESRATFAFRVINFAFNRLGLNVEAESRRAQRLAAVSGLGALTSAQSLDAIKPWLFLTDYRTRENALRYAGDRTFETRRELVERLKTVSELGMDDFGTAISALALSDDPAAIAALRAIPAKVERHTEDGLYRLENALRLRILIKSDPEDLHYLLDIANNSLGERMAPFAVDVLADRSVFAALPHIRAELERIAKDRGYEFQITLRNRLKEIDRITEVFKLKDIPGC